MPKIAIPDRLFFAADSANTPQHISCMSVFTQPDGTTGSWLDALERHFRAQTAAAAPFNFRLRHAALARVAPSLEVVSDDEIDYDHHFRRLTVAAPGGQRELDDMLSEMHSTPLDITRPLWEVLLIDGLEHNRFGLYFKVHHAIMDGIGGMSRITQMLSSDTTPQFPRALWTFGPAPVETKSSLAQRMRKAPDTLREGIRTAYELTRYAGTLATQGRFDNEPDVPVPFALPRTVFNLPISGRRRVATRSYDFARFQQVARAADAKLNDVFLAMCASGVRRYLSEVGTLPDVPLIAGAPVNVRDDDDQQSANSFTIFAIGLATDIADPLERLAAIARSGAAGKAKLQALPKQTAELYPAVYMGPLLAASIAGFGGRIAPPFTISTSNVPGPLAAQYLAGARLEATYPMAMLYHGNGLFVGLLTNSGRIAMALVADEKTVPHVNRLADYFDDALVELEQLLGLADERNAI